MSKTLTTVKMHFKKFRNILTAMLMIATGHIFAQGLVDDNVEKQALLDLYNSTSGGGAWVTRWNTTDLVNPYSVVANFTTTDFIGVTITNGDVTAIVLPDKNKVRGSIPVSINNLLQLRILNIRSRADNNGNANMISGALPDLSPLVNLTNLVLSENDCSGTVNWLVGANKIEVDLSNSGATSSKLTISSISFNTLINLVTLNLSRNLFVSNILSPNFDYLDKLTSLSLRYCNLSASSIPNQFGGMALLNYLDLTGNPIIDIPAPIGNLLQLNTLSLNAVGLHSLPNNFGQLDNLVTVSLGFNNITNNSDFYYVVFSLSGCIRLQYLDLNDNNLTEVSSNFSSLSALRSLNLSRNPIASSNLTYLSGSGITSLKLVECQLTSKLPNILTSLSSLSSLDIGNTPNPAADKKNSIDLSSSSVQSILTFLPSLKYLYIANNAIIGPGSLPGWFGSGSMSSLETLDVSGNTIKLPFLANFMLMVNLTTLNLTNNNLGNNTYSLPSNFNCSIFPKLANVYLGNNNLIDSIPDFSACAFLGKMDISGNKFSDELPTYFQSGLPALYELNISNNSFVSIPNLTQRANAATLKVTLFNNLFDFGDLDVFYNSTCGLKVESLSYSPQKAQSDLKGNAETFYVSDGMQATLTFQAPGSNNYYQWEQYISGSSWVVKSAYKSGPPILTNDSYLVQNATLSTIGTYHTKIKNRCLPGTELNPMEFTGKDVQLILIPSLCQSEIPKGTGTFMLDRLTGTIIYERNNCQAKVPISCMFGPSSTLDNVVSAKAITHSDNWSYSYLNLTPAGNPFESGERGKWRPKASYTQQTTLVQANDKNYNAGTFKFKPFNYKYGDKSNYPGWLKVSQVEKYSRHGEPVEERNAINIPSTAKFGYKGESMPYLIAQNAEYKTVLFESFETLYDVGNKFEDDFTNNAGALEVAVVLPDGKYNAHAGKNSFKLAGAKTVTVRSFPLNIQIQKNGMQTKVWVKGVVANNSLALQVFNQGNSLFKTVSFKWIANSGEWALYEATLLPSDLASIAVVGCGENLPLPSCSTFSLKIQYTGSATICIDDLRIQPKDSEMTAYVYETGSLRLLAVFDDQHFGLLYQFNAEGKLVRKMIETERGIKTIQETQYNSQKTTKVQ